MSNDDDDGWPTKPEEKQKVRKESIKRNNYP